MSLYVDEVLLGFFKRKIEKSDQQHKAVNHNTVNK